MPKPNLFIAYVSDVQRSAAFYADLFGMAPSFTSPRFITFEVAKGVQLGLWSGADDQPTSSQPRGSEICLNLPGGAEAIDECFADWAERDVTVVRGPHDDVFGRTFVIADPDGNLIRVAPVD